MTADTPAPSNLRRLWKSKELLYMLTWREINVRYKQSIMGLMWAVLMPSIIVGAGALVRVAAARMTGGRVTSDDIASVIVRAVAWAFIVGAIRFGTSSLVANPSLVTKIAFPKEVFPISSVLSNAFDFVVASIVVVVALLLIDWRPTAEVIWAVPLLLLLALFTTGLTLILSAMNLFYRDVKYIVEVMLTYAIFFTPVLFPAAFAGPWRTLILLNPVAPILEALSDTVVSHKPPVASWTTYSAVVAIVMLAFGYWFFKRLEAQFAERM